MREKAFIMVRFPHWLTEIVQTLLFLVCMNEAGLFCEDLRQTSSWDLTGKMLLKWEMEGGCGRASSMSLKGTGQEKGSRNSQNFPSCQAPGYGESDLVLWHQVWGTTEVKRKKSPAKFINFSLLVKDSLKPERE